MIWSGKAGVVSWKYEEDDFIFMSQEVLHTGLFRSETKTYNFIILYITINMFMMQSIDVSFSGALLYRHVLADSVKREQCTFNLN